jgi:hypothetical protein
VNIEASALAEIGMGELLTWLDGQGCGVSTYVLFRTHALTLSRASSENAAAGRLLADLAQQFVDSYDSVPLPIDVATEALGRLRAHVAAFVAAGDGEERLALLNKVACDRLGGELAQGLGRGSSAAPAMA